MSAPPNSKRMKPSLPTTAAPAHLMAQQQLRAFPGAVPFDGLAMPPNQMSVPNPRKRRASPPPGVPSTMVMPMGTAAEVMGGVTMAIPEPAPKKKSRTNTPWTAEEEQRLKTMRDTGLSWSEIAKTFPARTEGSVKKHWYKDMHYAEFAEDESTALREAIKEYEANKWKIIGQKVGKPAKACEQYAREHFKNV
ncbi:hypothetical protein ASPZODRAFT_148618 [Penicilliopsis zonata CBS 506.65]|uniref:Myb-like domain-containing protein n=1 Tax=Penicilliopsis zonata CBS 506.65 TaxID=1073090 RepID=A0A1L9SW83_9EURO|nr:hypothetical protein ASPZODRAFT_148618 [Penicilliopsis zonata CBS 506.65]OJJ51313.1 hypothetical protein ASPZODRAFT_148618 [Penicilliopsis zonata CBS 506.65]